MGWRYANQKETANLKPLAIVSLHASPVAALGAGETGGMNVYVRAVGEELSRRGIATEVFTRRSNAQGPDRIRLAERAWVTRLAVGPAEEIDKAHLFDLLPDFSEAILSEQRRRRTGYSLIHSHYWLSGWVASRLRDEWGLPWFHTFHTLARVKNERAAEGAIVEPEHRIAVEQAIVRHCDRLVALADSLGIGGQVRFLGSVDQPALASYLSLAAVCVVPSYSESFGLVALEAAACGTPVVAARVGGLPTIVKDGLTGFTLVSHEPAQYAERIGRLLADEELRLCFSRRSRLVATPFTWKDTVDRLVAEYTSHPQPVLRPAVAG